MHIFRSIVQDNLPAQASVTLPYHLRQKCRQQVVLDNGEVVGLSLPRGTVLQPGDRLLGSGDEFVVAVKAALEMVSTVVTDDPMQLARVCYHLGNRHVPLQIDKGRVRYLHDHVLDQMVMTLGLQVISEQAPFVPEIGAYAHGYSYYHSYV